MRANERLLDTFLELQILDRVPRSGWTLRGVPDPESVAEHSWHVTFLVWCLGREVPGLDRLRAVELALMHDVAEVRLGDLPLTAARYLPNGAKHAAEAAILSEVLAPLGAPEVEALEQEYRRKESAEARLVAACDKLQLLIKVAHYERWGAAGLSEFWDNPANFPDSEFEPVRRVAQELRDRLQRRTEKQDPVSPV
jgi:putative hydrolase of HD superfamily